MFRDVPGALRDSLEESEVSGGSCKTKVAGSPFYRGTCQLFIFPPSLGGWRQVALSPGTRKRRAFCVGKRRVDEECSCVLKTVSGGEMNRSPQDKCAVVAYPGDSPLDLAQN